MSEANRYKYKIWDEEAKCFCSEDTIQALGLSLSTEGKITYKCLDKVLNSSVFEPVFSTGLVDSKGVEIFEGDILRLPAKQKITGIHTFNINTPMAIEWGRLNSIEPSEEMIGFQLPEGWGKMEIIGNIHEHPHLLKESKND